MASTAWSDEKIAQSPEKGHEEPQTGKAVVAAATAACAFGSDYESDDLATRSLAKKPQTDTGTGRSGRGRKKGSTSTRPPGKYMPHHPPPSLAKARVRVKSPLLRRRRRRVRGVGYRGACEAPQPASQQLSGFEFASRRPWLLSAPENGGILKHLAGAAREGK